MTGEFSTMTQTEEAILVRRAQQGDQEAYGRLAELYGGSLLGIAYSGVSNFTAAEDIAQDALLLGFEKLSDLRRPGKFGGWIRTIARNLCCQWRKNAAYRRALEQENGALRERFGYSDAPSALAALEVQERHGQLKVALDALPEAEREALLAFYFEGQRMEAAAAGAGISTAAMRKRVQRGRDRLRAALNKEVDAALQEAGNREGRSTKLLAALGAGAVYSRASAERVLPVSSGLGLPTAAYASLVAAVLMGIGGTLVWNSLVRDSDPNGLVTATGRDVSHVVPATSVPATVAIPHAESATWPPSLLLAAQAQAPEAANLQDGIRSVAGTITDALGRPVQGAQVEAIAPEKDFRPQQRERMVIARAVSDDSGDYLLEGLPGDTAVSIRAFHADWAVSTRTLDTAKDGELAFDPVAVDLQLLRPDVLRGVVIDSEGHPIERASVSVWAAQSQAYMAGEPGATAERMGAGGRHGESFGGLAEATTDASGRFAVGNLPEGWVLSLATATKPGYGIGYYFSRAGLRNREQDFAQKNSTRWSDTHIPVPWDPVSITLGAAATLSGHVTRAEDGQPVASAEVTLSGGIGSPNVHHGDRTLTDENGHYQFNDLPAMDVQQLIARKGSETSPYVARPLVAGAEATADLALAPGVSIAGTVVDTATEAPVPNVLLNYMQEGVYGPIHECWADDSGRFSLNNLPPGAWRLNVRGHTLSREHYGELDYFGLTFELASPGSRDNTVIHVEPANETPRSRGNVIAGLVVEGRGKPVGGALVWLVPGRERRLPADRQGAFRFERVPSGDAVLHGVDPVNYRHGTLALTLGTEEEIRATLALDGPASRVAGAVVDASGNPLDLPAHVELLFGPVPLDIMVEGSGTFDSGAIPPGRYNAQLRLDTQGYRVEGGGEVNVPAGAFIDDLDFVVTRMAGAVRGRVTDGSGNPVSNLPVTVGAQTGLARTTTANDGRYTAEHLDADSGYVLVGEASRGGKGGEKPWAWENRTHLNSQPHDVTVHAPGVLKLALVLPKDLDDSLTLGLNGDLGYVDSFTPATTAMQLHLQPDRYQITLNSGSVALLDASVVVRSGETTDLGELRPLDNRGVFAGAATQDGGQPLDGISEAQITLEALDGGDGRYHARPEEDGSFRINYIRPGTYRAIFAVLLNRSSRLAVQHDVVVEAGQETHANFDLIIANTVISGRITVEEGERAVIWLFDASTDAPNPGEPLPPDSMRSVRAGAMADDSGDYHIDGAAPGRYRLIATRSTNHENVVAHTEIVELVEGAPMVWNGAE